MEQVYSRLVALFKMWRALFRHRTEESSVKRMSDSGLQLLRTFEGFVGHLYNDKAGHATIGYGHLVHLGPINGTEPAEFKAGITKDRGEELLRLDVTTKAENPINALVKLPITQNEFDALCCFVYNVGVTDFKDSHLLSRLNAADFNGAAAQFARWNHAGGVVLSDLTMRRAQEEALFLSA